MYKKCVLIAATTAITLTASAKERTTVIRPAYGAHMLRVMPLTVFNGGVGLGLSYERILDKDGKVGLNIPMSIGIKNKYNNLATPSNEMNYTFLINPGIKFYPTGQRKVTYALGASLFAALGTYDGNYYRRGMYRYEEGNLLQAGIMINNYLQFNISPKANIGLELGVGPSYLNQYTESTTSTSRNTGIGVMAQLGFHIGYRF
ncbi:hypothetical protein DBR32_10920 [Taibaiella sp. KBW10]|uniref:hypothetical protein n=1 Tax=Taibaiella sp. KBW10 TaxID=2153357 RepID=UPI000F595D25|nr:hypothetical protein [Taibaiella sp. KBW10]RQO30091.1 hypothetical protein DBR32_10920 [Taibaiella sp. KBW10]